MSPTHPYAMSGVDVGLAELGSIIDDVFALAERAGTEAQADRRLGIALGMIMARHGVTEHEAGALLARDARSAGSSLPDAAEAVITRMPAPATGRRLPRHSRRLLASWVTAASA